MTARPPTRIPVADLATDRALEDVRRSVGEVIRDPYLTGRDLEVTLPNATQVAVHHGLGRRFTNYSLSAPMGATSTGRIVESAPDDDRLTIYLTATGFGATVTVRMRVW